MNRGYVSTAQRASRGLSSGEITDLSAGFKLKNGSPFGIIVIPKENISGNVISQPTNIGLIVNGTQYENADPSDFPVQFNWETVGLYYQLSPNAINLANYRVFWSCGFNDEPAV